MAKISIVIPVYYNAPTLPALFERLDGVVKANPQHWFEFICVDDGSAMTLSWSYSSLPGRTNSSNW